MLLSKKLGLIFDRNHKQIFFIISHEEELLSCKKGQYFRYNFSGKIPKFHMVQMENLLADNLFQLQPKMLNVISFNAYSSHNLRTNCKENVQASEWK